MIKFMTHPPLLAIVGPTGVGKTRLSLSLAQRFEGQIVGADSRQIYQHMDIGTAKPTPDQLNLVPHHLVDVVPPDKVITLAEYQERAYAAIEMIHQAGDLPLLVGGTGQWVKSVTEGWGIPRVPPDPELRARLEAEAVARGKTALHTDLAQVDPEAGVKIDPRNLRRVIRALEVYYKTDIPISVHQKKSPPPYRILQIGLTMPRENLYERTDANIDRMMAQGLLAETETLLAKGYGWNLPAMSGLGYKQLGLYLRGELPLDEAVALIKKETKRFVRQQYNWFQLTDEQIQWIDVTSPDFETTAIAIVKLFLEEDTP